MQLTKGAKVFLGLGALAIASNYYFKRRNVALEATANEPRHREHGVPVKGELVLPPQERSLSAKQQKGAPTSEESMMDKLSSAGHIAKVHGKNIVEDMTEGAKEIAGVVTSPGTRESGHRLDDANRKQLQLEREQSSGRDAMDHKVKRGGLMYEGDIWDVPETKFDKMDSPSMQRKDRYDLRSDGDFSHDARHHKVDKIIVQEVKPRMEQVKEGVKSMVRGETSRGGEESRRPGAQGGGDRYLDRLNEMMEDTRSRFENIKAEARDSVTDPKRTAGQPQRSVGDAISRGKEQGQIEAQQKYGQWQDRSAREGGISRSAHDQSKGPSPRKVEHASDLFHEPRSRPDSPGTMERMRGELEEMRGRGPDSRDKGSRPPQRDQESGVTGKLMDKATDAGIISPETRESMAQKAENVKDVLASHAYDASKDVQKRKAAIQAGEPKTDVIGSQVHDASIDVAKGVGELKEAVSGDNVDTSGTTSPMEHEELHAAKPFVYKESHRPTTPTKFVSPREAETMK